MEIGNISTLKESYVNLLQDKSKKFRYIYIYGAGNVAEIVANLLEKEKIEYVGYCVSDEQQDKIEKNGKKIYSLSEIESKNNETFFIIATKGKYLDEIKEKLETKQYSNYICPSLYLRYFDETEYEKFIQPEIEITTVIGCIVNCRYCPQNILLNNYCNNKTKMTLNDFKICVDKLPKDSTIVFSGFAEPFLNKECTDMILYADQKGFKLKLYTTLVGLNENDFDKIKDIDFLEVVIHLADEDNYANIKITEEYCELLSKVINYKKKDGTPFVSYANCQSKPAEIVTRIINNKVRVTGQLIDRAGNLNDEDLVSNRTCNNKERFCERSGNLNHNVLLPDGRVVICCMDFSLKHVMGNLITDSYVDVVENNYERKKVLSALSGTSKHEVLCDSCTSTKYVE